MKRHCDARRSKDCLWAKCPQHGDPDRKDGQGLKRWWRKHKKKYRQKKRAKKILAKLSKKDRKRLKKLTGGLK